MKKILFPVDFSPISASAAKYGPHLPVVFMQNSPYLHVAPGHAPYNE